MMADRMEESMTTKLKRVQKARICPVSSNSMFDYLIPLEAAEAAFNSGKLGRIGPYCGDQNCYTPLDGFTYIGPRWPT
jgi:hypothetical protein